MPSFSLRDAVKSWFARLIPGGEVAPISGPGPADPATGVEGGSGGGDGLGGTVGERAPGAGEGSSEPASPLRGRSPAGAEAGDPERTAGADGPDPVLVVQDGTRPTGGPAVRAVNRILLAALEARASDVHVEVQGGEMRVRLRVDGILQEMESPPDGLASSILARLRVMGGLDLAEHRRPQDGRMRVLRDDRTIDIRVSSVPMLRGESLVLRMLDPGRERFALDELGLADDDYRHLVEALSRPHGMLLTTGPGGSGKSTTLYAVVEHLSTGREKILTAEDPIELDVEGVCQVPVNRRGRLSFAGILRSLVRQDPDVLLVGEIRDEETADIATHAALTGHKVLSTIHTADAPSTLHRMHELKVPDYLVTHTVDVVLAQRLVRLVCERCAEEVEPDPDRLRELGPAAEGLGRVRRGRGCEACFDTGYLGRTGVFELLVVTDALREAFSRRESLGELRTLARREGMRTLREDAVAKVRAGRTTPEEVLRVT